MEHCESHITLLLCNLSCKGQNITWSSTLKSGSSLQAKRLFSHGCFLWKPGVSGNKLARSGVLICRNECKKLSRVKLHTIYSLTWIWHSQFHETLWGKLIFLITPDMFGICAVVWLFLEDKTGNYGWNLFTDEKLSRQGDSWDAPIAVFRPRLLWNHNELVLWRHGTHLCAGDEPGA